MVVEIGRQFPRRQSVSSVGGTCVIDQRSQTPNRASGSPQPALSVSVSQSVGATHRPIRASLLGYVLGQLGGVACSTAAADCDAVVAHAATGGHTSVQQQHVNLVATLI